MDGGKAPGGFSSKGTENILPAGGGEGRLGGGFSDCELETHKRGKKKERGNGLLPLLRGVPVRTLPQISTEKIII